MDLVLFPRESGGVVGSTETPDKLRAIGRISAVNVVALAPSLTTATSLFLNEPSDLVQRGLSVACGANTRSCSGSSVFFLLPKENKFFIEGIVGMWYAWI